MLDRILMAFRSSHTGLKELPGGSLPTGVMDSWGRLIFELPDGRLAVGTTVAFNGVEPMRPTPRRKAHVRGWRLEYDLIPRTEELDAAQGMETAKPLRHEVGSARKGDSPVAESDAPKDNAEDL